MSETTPKNAVFEKPKAMWVVGAWLSTVAAVLGVGFLWSGSTFTYGGTFSLLVGAWGIYAVGRHWSRPRMTWLGLLAVWTLGLDWWYRGIELIGRWMLEEPLRSAPVLHRYAVLASSMMIFTSAIGGGLAGAVTRSRRAFWVCVSASLLMVGMIFDIPALDLTLFMAWHSIVLGTVVVWAVHTRLKRLSGHCIWCGYDLAGIEGPVCPECGRARVMAAGPVGA